MINQNIKICIGIILSMITTLLLIFKFIKVDKSSQALITTENDEQSINIDNELSSYIEKHQINNIKILYNRQYYSCEIFYFKKIQDFTKYWVFLPPNVILEDQYFLTNIIVDSLDFYHYLLTKLR